MKSNPDITAKLNALKAERKFVEEDFYCGAPTDEIRKRCEDRVNAYIGAVTKLCTKWINKTKSIYRASDKLESEFEFEDTEEREKVGDYIGEVMNILGFDDSQ